MKKILNQLRSGFLPVAPSLDVTIGRNHFESEMKAVNTQTIMLCLLACLLGTLSAVVAQILTHLIGLVTNLFFFQRISFDFISPYNKEAWGYWVIFIPVIGGLIVGIMARFGSKAIRGHGIPEAMENILINESRIPLRLTFLKPLSAAIAIGTGGPFGAEGPIIATGAALGSVMGQWLRLAATHRKILLAAGAAAGMTATFGSPISAVLLAVELLLFEFKPHSIIPVAIAASTAEAVRASTLGTAPIFAMTPISNLPGSALAFSLLVGAVMGVASVLITKSVYAVEDNFEKLPIHWMWWPAIGGVAVGVVGYFFPSTLGVGYGNIESILHGDMLPSFMIVFCSMKFISWLISLGSGTSGGTLAPLFTFGGGMGSLLGFAALQLDPQLGITVGMAGLVGMAAIFAGASRALLASVVFAFEVTQQPLGLMPLLAGCSVSYLISGILMKNSIMTEKIERRGVKVPVAYFADPLGHLYVRDCYSSKVCSFLSETKVSEVYEKVLHFAPPYDHLVYPVVDKDGLYIGVVTREDLIQQERTHENTIGNQMKKNFVSVKAENTLRFAQNLMRKHQITVLPVVDSDGRTLKGILSQSDIIKFG